jgi:general secretion pathway protein I
MKAKRQGQRGFTLLEIMVAVAILGLGLTAILSAQAGAFSSAQYARNLSVATGLLRCKITEVEEHVYKDGFQETDETGAGPCCDGDDNPIMRGSWRVDRPQFPEAKFGDLNLNAGLDLTGGGSSGASGAPPALGALGLLSAAGAGANPLAGASNMGDVAKTLADANSQAAQGLTAPPSPSGSAMGSIPGGPGAPTDPSAGAGMGGLASMAMSIVYPSLKQVFEASTRRITVTLVFTQGKKEHTVELSEWISLPQKGLAVDDQGAGASDITGGTSSSGSSGSSGKSSSGSSGSSGKSSSGGRTK